MKYYKVERVDGFDYQPYTSWESEEELRREESTINMQRVKYKVEVTKEEYDANKHYGDGPISEEIEIVKGRFTNVTDIKEALNNCIKYLVKLKELDHKKDDLFDTVDDIIKGR